MPANVRLEFIKETWPKGVEALKIVDFVVRNPSIDAIRPDISFLGLRTPLPVYFLIVFSSFNFSFCFATDD